MNIQDGKVWVHSSEHDGCGKGNLMQCDSSDDTYRLEFVFLEGRDEVANEEWQIAAKIDDFVHDECDHASNKDFILAIVKLDPVLFSPRQFINGSCVHC